MVLFQTMELAPSVGSGAEWSGINEAMWRSSDAECTASPACVFDSVHYVFSPAEVLKAEW